MATACRTSGYLQRKWAGTVSYLGRELGYVGNEDGGNLGIWLECLRRKSTLEEAWSPSTRPQSLGSKALLPTFRHSPTP